MDCQLQEAPAVQGGECTRHLTTVGSAGGRGSPKEAVVLRRKQMVAEPWSWRNYITMTSFVSSLREQHFVYLERANAALLCAPRRPV